MQACYLLPTQPEIDTRRVDTCVEAICHLGCRTVRAIITLLEQQQAVPELAELNAQERRMVLGELRTIMAVYGTTCRI